MYNNYLNIKQMEKIGTDNQKRRELISGAQHACYILNTIVMPICKDLSFTIDATDAVTLNNYIRDLSTLHSDYIAAMVEGESNPALSVVVKKAAEELWHNANAAHPLKNPYIISEIPSDIMAYLTLTGSDIYTFHARANNPAIEKACVIEATPEDLAKRDEIKAVCDALNDCFNGLGNAFNQFIYIAQDGRFYPIQGVKNYKALVYGANYV